MRRKSLGICVLLLGLLLGASSIAHADTIAITSVSLSKLSDRSRIRNRRVLHTAIRIFPAQWDPKLGIHVT